jgi:hypothetical protein
MAESLVFDTNHPVTLRWIDEAGMEIGRRGRLHSITNNGLAVMLTQPLESPGALKRGDHVSIEAGEFHGRHLTVFHGSVVSVESRLVRIALSSGVEVLQRRRFPRAKLQYRFATAIKLVEPVARYFVAQPIDLSGGGVRLSHRLPLREGDRFRLIVRLTRKTMVTPIAEVIETWEQPTKPSRWPQPPRFVSRATFVELSPRDRTLITGYVAKVLEGLDRRRGATEQPAPAAGRT